MTNIAIAGAAGRMGKMLVDVVSTHPSMKLAVAVEHEGHPDLGRDVGEVAQVAPLGVAITDDLVAAIDMFDVLIDFTIAPVTERNVGVCWDYGRKMVIGTTGLDDAQMQVVEDASCDIAIVKAHNFSVGVNATFKLAEVAAEILGDDVDVEIIEAHHRHKVDAPSGTAIGLGEAVAKALDRNLKDVALFGREGITGERSRSTIGFHSIRAGEIVGEHTVIFAGATERVELKHVSLSRSAFAEGAVRSAGWVMSKEHGLFDMRDVLNMK